jgi:hypothetical protein
VQLLWPDLAAPQMFGLTGRMLYDEVTLFAERREEGGITADE